MRKKTIFGTLVIIGALIVSSLPAMLAETFEPDQPKVDCWVVTDDVEDLEIDEHDFYTERDFGTDLESDHEQVWYKDTKEPRRISDDNEWINTTVICSAVHSGDNVILTVVTKGDQALFEDEELRWTVINGYEDSVFTVKVIWYEWKEGDSSPNQQTVTVTIDDISGPDVIELNWTQALSLELTFVDQMECPDQKYYWIETDYHEHEGKEWQYNDYGPTNHDPVVIEGPIDQTWWTDYDCEPIPIGQHDPPWHMNTKVLVWAEVSGVNAILYVKSYGQSNYFPEQINWTISLGGIQPDAYFNVVIDVDGQQGASDWDTDVTIGADPLFREIGTLDHLYVTLTYYEPE